MTLLGEKKPSHALRELERAVLLDPANAELRKAQGNAYKALGNLQAAAECYRRSLEIRPDLLPSLYNLAVVLGELGQQGESEQCLRRLLAAEPADVEALFQLGLLLAAQGRQADAADAYREALRLAPANAYLWMHLGMACQESPERLGESVEPLKKSIELEPQLAQAHYRLGLSLKKLGRIDEAIDAYRKSLDLAPDAAEAHNDLANILQDRGQVERAIEHYRHAVRLAPGYAIAHNNLGVALIRQGRLEEAADCLRTALAQHPENADAHFNLGSVFGLLGLHGEALRCLQAAERYRPDHPGYKGALLFEMQQVCDWSRFAELSARHRRNVLERPDQPLVPFSLLSIPSTAAEQLRCGRNHAERVLASVAADGARLRLRFERQSRRRIKLGYLSADFREHAVAHLIAEVLELHDRKRFEIAGYSYGADDASPLRARLVRAFDEFVDIRALSHADAAARIHRDAVDILVDLQGYTQHARTEIPALRPAPIQVGFLGYTATTGAPFIDYLVVDRFIAPPGLRDQFSEKLVLMPGSFQANDRRRQVGETPPRSELGLPDEAFVFCCFNQSYKIMPDVFAAWTRLLSAAPHSVLWLLETNSWAAENLRQEAARAGVDPARVIFAPFLAHSLHLGRMRAADLVLDTRPYNAHTTASDALWVGVPAVTCPGETFASRVAGSLLIAMDMPELITGSMAEYEALARRLARDPAGLAALREKLARNRTSALLFDTVSYTRNLETAYEKMWARHRAGEAPSTIEL